MPAQQSVMLPACRVTSAALKRRFLSDRYPLSVEFKKFEIKWWRDDTVSRFTFNWMPIILYDTYDRVSDMYLHSPSIYEGTIIQSLILYIYKGLALIYLDTAEVPYRYLGVSSTTALSCEPTSSLLGAHRTV